MRFTDLTAKGKQDVISALRTLPIPQTGEDQDRRLKYTQREWLTAIKDQPEAAQWYAELSGDPQLGLPSDHPDFLSYHETSMGPGPTPFGQESDLLRRRWHYHSASQLIPRNGSMERAHAWRPYRSVEAAVASAPNTFLPLLSAFHAAKFPFQYALIEGFKRAFDKSKESGKSKI